MASPQTLRSEPMIQDTNIDQSILFELFEIEQKCRATQTMKSEPMIQDTNIDQSILFELFEVEQKCRATQVLDKKSTVMSKYEVDEIVSIEDFEEEEEYPEVVGKTEYPELPDISEYEKMIDWDDIPDTEDFSEGEKNFYNSSDN